MKKALALTCAMTMAASLFLTGCGGSDYTTMSGNGSDNNSGSSNGSGKRVVNVCSWGEYIDEDLIYKFEDETGIKVNYQTAESNEALYSLLKTGAGDYDVIVPSDYMIARLIDEGMLAELQSPCLLETMTRFLEYAKDRFDLLCLLFYSYGGAVAKSGCVAVC